ncbi:MAG: hypothetical protein D3923_07265 [Candidatus Electrothrix sp. AR3]|nr:hypothetical protein [Candidatus Electrothrix sp. AR3]
MGVIADNGGMNVREDIMDKLNENSKFVDKSISGVKDTRINILRGKYSKPLISELISSECKSAHECSDMASWQSCCNNGGD